MSSNADRLSSELSLLEAMYPDSITYSPKTGDLTFHQDGNTLALRLPETYPTTGHPEILSANNASKADLRQTLRSNLHLVTEDEECLDTIISTFLTLASQATSFNTSSNYHTSAHEPESSSSKTVIIWLHHLLNTNKRKLALSPSSPGVSGLTKPGYPGILLFTGLSSAVTEHVNELKQQNWQAFQIRYEREDEEWVLQHGKGVKEVETMAELAKSVDVKEGQKEAFLKATGVK